jgi:hypothetical protein
MNTRKYRFDKESDLLVRCSRLFITKRAVTKW